MGDDVADVEAELLEYLEQAYTMDQEISLTGLQALFSKASPGEIRWTSKGEGGIPLLHLAAMNEATMPKQLFEVVTELLKQGAPALAKDEDGDTALEAVISLSEELEEGEADHVKVVHMAVVRAFLRFPGLPVDGKLVNTICSWLRQSMPEKGRSDILSDLAARVGQEPVVKAWRSEEFLQYLEKRSYEKQKGVEAKRVQAFLESGASPSHTQNGASALLLIVLNPYSSLDQLLEVFGLMLRVDPGAVAIRDGFKLAPMQWAVDYANVAQQCNLKRPNPAVLLALFPRIIELVPADIDSGVACFKLTPTGRSMSSPPPEAASKCTEPLRFMEGDRVVCLVENPGGGHEWEEGGVVGLWYRETCWPPEHPGAPYEVLLDIGTKVFALADSDRIIRIEKTGASRAKETFSESAPADGPAASTNVATSGKRFQKRQRDDGSWELVDLVSGKCRPAPPPDSDDDD